jgi:hypothetical protein
MNGYIYIVLRAIYAADLFYKRSSKCKIPLSTILTKTKILATPKQKISVAHKPSTLRLDF